MDKYIEQGIRVFRMNDYEWYATKLEYCEDINKWYITHIVDENCLDDVEISDLDINGVWCETNDSKDIKRLGEADELCTGEIVINGEKHPQFKIGDLHRKNGICYKLISFRDEIKNCLKEGESFSEPMLISILN
ncbi:TPA: hypothetical protein ACH354_002316 [Clostridium perfringens]